MASKHSDGILAQIALGRAKIMAGSGLMFLIIWLFVPMAPAEVQLPLGMSLWLAISFFILSVIMLLQFVRERALYRIFMGGVK